MSCNGCRILRKACSESCILKPSLQWIDNSEAQAHATLFLARFYGRSDLMAFISAAPDHKKPAVFQSLLLEACGRTINPVNGAVGLLSTGNWNLCEAAVDTVLSGGTVGPIPGILAGNMTPDFDESVVTFGTDVERIRDSYSSSNSCMQVAMDAQPAELTLAVEPPRFSTKITARRSRGKRSVAKFNSEQSSVVGRFANGGDDRNKQGSEEGKVLNLFV